MTPENRKKLGINKSTLFYMKKNIKDGKNIKIYDKIIKKIKLIYCVKSGLISSTES
jgi:hypothetical protein